MRSQEKNSPGQRLLSGLYPFTTRSGRLCRYYSYIPPTHAQSSVQQAYFSIILALTFLKGELSLRPLRPQRLSHFQTLCKYIIHTRSITHTNHFSIISYFIYSTRLPILKHIHSIFHFVWLAVVPIYSINPNIRFLSRPFHKISFCFFCDGLLRSRNAVSRLWKRERFCSCVVFP